MAIFKSAQRLERQMYGRQMSQTADFPGRQLSLQPNVQEPNVLGAKCPERQLSRHKMSKAPNVRARVGGRHLSPFHRILTEIGHIFQRRRLKDPFKHVQYILNGLEFTSS